MRSSRLQKCKRAFIPRLFNTLSNFHLAIRLVGGCQGDVQKVPIQSAKDVLKTREATDWIADQFIPRGRLTLLAGASGSGKSSLLYGLAEAVSNGSDFMGQLTTKRGKVCFIQSDESPENAADKLKVMGVKAEFHLLTDWKFLDVSKLRALQEQEHYDLIVLDSITTLLGAGRPDGPSMNDAALDSISIH